ncbi:MAG: sigma-70 family RNA polymerase sigma factor [Solirubrobacterales bacterium]
MASEREARRAVEAVWRIESARLIAGLARTFRDVGIAEDLASEALLAALEQWPSSGIPDNPGAWLAATARNRGVDRIRRERVAERKSAELGRELELREEDVQRDLAAELDDPFDDDLLRLIFTTCHPVLSTDARVALTLRLLGGLTTPEIARAYLTSEATVAQRIARAKRTLRAARVPIEAPDRAELPDRLGSVLEVIYLIFNEGYSPSSGTEVVRAELVEEALRLGRVLAELLPEEPEVHGLAALMELQASRTRTRVDAAGDPVPLLEQDRARWDWMLVERGNRALGRAYATGGSFGPYALQAAIAACHGRARIPGDTDWEWIAALYDGLAEIAPSPVVELNRAIAFGMAFGPDVALTMLGDASLQRALASYPLLPAARGDMLERAGRRVDAAAEFERAAELSGNARQAAFLRRRAAASRSADAISP